jgi:hypothetical protein
MLGEYFAWTQPGNESVTEIVIPDIRQSEGFQGGFDFTFQAHAWIHRAAGLTFENPIIDRS